MSRRSITIVAPLFAVLVALLIGLFAAGALSAVDTPSVTTALPGRPTHGCNSCV